MMPPELRVLSKLMTAALGALLATAGFALGHFVASSSARPRPIDTPAPLGAEQARAALEAIVREPATLANARRLADRLAQLGPDAVPAILPTLRDPSENLDAARALLLIQFWIDRDPQSAAQWAQTNAPFLYKMLALQLSIERLAESDPTAARRLAGTDRQFLKPLVRGWVRSGQPGVEGWIRDLGPGFERQKAIGAYARERIRRDGIAAVTAWAEALPDSEDGFKLDAFRRVTTELTYADPAAGVAWFEKHRGGPYGEDLLLSVGNAWVAEDGPAAMRWLSERPPGTERDNAVLDAIRAWSMSDHDALTHWAPAAKGEPIAAWFQPGLPIYAKLVGAKQPAEGIGWAERIDDAGQRAFTIVQISRRWRQLDPAAADAWLAQSPLSEAERSSAKQPFAPPAKK